MSRSPVNLLEVKTQKLVPAVLVTNVTIREAVLAQQAWSEALNEILSKAGQSDWPEHAGWDWERKFKKFGRLSAYKFYGVECERKFQGLLLLRILVQTSRLELKKQVIYGVYLASAPWNLEIKDNRPRYKLVGSVLVAAAVQASRDEGCEGRFALHSLKQAEQFYESCGMTNLGHDESHEDQLTYFEMTKKAAQIFLPMSKK